MKVIYCINETNESARTLVGKLSGTKIPDEIICLTPEEMIALSDEKQFIRLPIYGKDEWSWGGV